MSIGHRLENDELLEASTEALYTSLGDGDTPKLFAHKFKIDTDHDVPMGAGNSVDMKTVYVDRTLYQQAMDNEFKGSGLLPQQVVGRWLDHEHTEIAIVFGDNPVDTYAPAHERALKREHEGVLNILGRDNAEQKIRKYEETIWPALMECYHRDPRKPPLDLWCSPLLDDPTPRDEELLEILRRAGVVDARKRARYDVHYGIGQNQCRRCAMFRPDLISMEHKQLALCDAVAGLVRDTRWCELWIQK